MKRLPRLGMIFLAVVPVLVPRNAHADAIAVSSINFSNLQIRPTTGTVVFGVWTAQGFAQAQNSLGEADAQFSSSDSGVATVSASVTFANALGSADPAGLTGLAGGSINVTGVLSLTQAITVGQGSLFNTFTVTGGTGSTEVDFSALVGGLLSVITNEFADGASTSATFNLLVNGNSVLFFNSTLTGGPNFNSTTPFSELLTWRLTLDFDTPYFLFIQADSEANAISNVPEPSTLTMMLAGLGIMAVVLRKRSAGRRLN